MIVSCEKNRVLVGTSRFISPIRLIGAEGEQLGVMPTFEASTKRATLVRPVEVAADERPPVCRILDYGKLRFTTSQKGNKSSKVRQQKLKEIRFRPKTDEQRQQTKAVQARKFLEHNDKVQVMVLFRGREMQHQEEVLEGIDLSAEKVAFAGTVENPSPMMMEENDGHDYVNKSAAKPKPKIKPEVIKMPKNVKNKRRARTGLSLTIFSLVPRAA